MTSISVIVPCHSDNGFVRLLSLLNNQTAANFEIVVAYDPNEFDSETSLLKQNTNSRTPVKIQPCSPTHGKYEPFISDTEMYIQAAEVAQGDYLVLGSETVNYPPSFIEKIFNRISADGTDICITPLAVTWPDNETTVYDSQISESDPGYFFTKSGIPSLFSNAASCWWLYSPENRIIKKNFFKDCTAGLSKFFSRHNAHLELDSLILFSEIMSHSPEISYEKSTYTTMVWKNQDERISNFFSNVNHGIFIDETEDVLRYVNDEMSRFLNMDISAIRTFNHNYISRLIWRHDWCFKEIQPKLEKLYDTTFDKFSLDLIGSHGIKLSDEVSILNSDLSRTRQTASGEIRTDADIAVYVSMHKRSYIPEDNRYIVPIQVGAAIAEERFSGMIHDDDARDNISDKNKMYCEMTSQYHVWKNIRDKDYYGFWHYRRYFSFNEAEQDNEWGIVAHPVLNEESLRASLIDEEHLLSACHSADIIVPRKWHCVEEGREMTIYDHWCKHFNKFDIDTTLKIILKKYPDYYDAAMDVLHSTSAIFCNMFIMDREHFEEYSRFCFDVLFEAEQLICQDTYNIEEYRTLGHIGERLLAIYVTYIEMKYPNARVKYVGRVQYGDTRSVAVVDYPEFLSKKIGTEYKELDITPVKAVPVLSEKNDKYNRNNCISVMLACNDAYMVYTDVLLQSVRANINPNFYYDIVICHRDISEYNQNVAKEIFNDCPNVLLRFADVSRNFDKYQNVHIDRHLTYETYYRFLVLDVFRDYDRVLYLDCDMVVNSDISRLFFTQMNDEYIAAVRDYDFIANCLVNSDFYKEKILKHIRIDSYFNYFQAGMILFNLASLRKDGFTTAGLFETALSRNWYFHDQDVLNCLFNGRIKYVNDKWNVFTLLEKNSAREKLILRDLAARYAESYKKSASEPRIVHYAGVPKVWNDSSIHLGSIFWKYARQSPFYESLLNTHNNGEGDKRGWIVFARQPKKGGSVHFFTVRTIKEAYSSDYCVIDFIYLSDHKNIKTNTLVINLSLFPHQSQKFWLDVKEFRWETDDDIFKDNIFYKVNKNFELEIHVREMDIYTGFSFTIRELQSRTINKPFVSIISSEFIK